MEAAGHRPFRANWILPRFPARADCRTAVVRLDRRNAPRGWHVRKCVFSRGLEFMNVACCVHPLAVWAPGPLASASGSLIVSVLATLAISLRLLGIRAREVAETPFRDGLLPQFA